MDASASSYNAVMFLLPAKLVSFAAGTCGKVKMLQSLGLGRTKRPR